MVVNAFMSRLTGLPESARDQVAERVTEIVTDVSAIVAVPGNAHARKYFVASKTNPTKPHLVDATGKNGKITCDCLRCKTSKLCPHNCAVAVAQNLEEDFARWLNKNTQLINLNSVVGHALPNSVAEKPHERTKRRLGRTATGISVTAIKGASGTLALAEKSSAGNRVPSGSQSQSRKREEFADPSGEVTPAAHKRKTVVSYTATKKAVERKSGATKNTAPALQGRGASSALPVATMDCAAIAPKPYEWEVHFLDDCHPMTRSCSGCPSSLLENRVVPEPPLDIVLVTQMERKYKHLNELKTAAKMSNAYFHPRMDCISNVFKDFNPEEIQISNTVRSKLETVHKKHLNFWFGLGL